MDNSVDTGVAVLACALCVEAQRCGFSLPGKGFQLNAVPFHVKRHRDVAVDNLGDTVSRGTGRAGCSTLCITVDRWE